ncbi:MAG: hypothetical protein R3293_23000 [Candidatus Promineifilaceae bacterium]|nr:hypothetical protein [Candidatus Promineifilaceae bacterium]
MLPDIQDVDFIETIDRLKVTLPVRRQWIWFALFSVLIVLWLVGLVWGVVFTIRDVALSGERYAFVFTIMLLVWLYLWYRLGKVLWRLWQYYAAGREILFVDKEQLIVRRPVSILGITDAYDFEYVSPFFFSSKHDCPGFDYGNQRVYFGRDLKPESAQALVKALNARFFSYADEDY